MFFKPTGEKLEGNFVNGLVQGEGTLTFVNENVYMGEMVDSKPHGKGTLLMKNHDKYVGEWKSGNRHG